MSNKTQKLAKFIDVRMKYSLYKLLDKMQNGGSIVDNKDISILGISIIYILLGVILIILVLYVLQIMYSVTPIETNSIYPYHYYSNRLYNSSHQWLTNIF